MNVFTLFFQLIIKYKISRDPSLRTAYFELKLKLRNYQYNFFERSFNELLEEYKVIERDTNALIGYIPFSLLKHNGIVSLCIEFEKKLTEHLLRRFVFLPECDSEAYINLLKVQEVLSLSSTDVEQYLSRRVGYFGKYNNEKPIIWPSSDDVTPSAKIVEFSEFSPNQEVQLPLAVAMA